MLRHSVFALPTARGRARLFGFVILVSFLITGFLFLTSVKAQSSAPDEQLEAAPTDVVDSNEEVDSVPAEDVNLAEEPKKEQSAEALLDGQASWEDLGAARAGILPDSPWHFFKRVGQDIQEAFTFDAVKDAALKHKHANQQLAEVKQMLEEKGINGVAPDVLTKAIDRFEDKMAKVAEAADDLKQAKTSNPVAVENLLDEVTDKQIKRQKLLDNFGDELVEIKREAINIQEEIPAVNNKLLENVLGKLQETNENSLQSMTEVLTTVEDKPKDVSDRIVKVLDWQEGSEFRDIKNLEILEFMKRRAPVSVKEALDLARQETMEKFQVRVKEIPAAVRAEKFKNYVSDIGASETRLFQLLEDIKHSANIPGDILDKIEEAKELVVGRFEEKMALLDSQDIKEKFRFDFDTNEMNNLVVLDDFKYRMSPGNEELKLIEEQHKKGLGEFTKKFTDAKSQEQAELFQKLSREMMVNPSPKTFKLLMELEEKVKADPEKRAFLEKMEEEMRQNVENKFRREGEKFAGRFSSLDPKDMAVLETVEFNDDFKEKMFQKSADNLKQYTQKIERPEEFDKFYDRFQTAPNIVVERIKEYDPNFQNAMQFKVRKMETVRAEKERDVARAKLDYKEREVNFQMDRAQRQKEDKFWNTINSVPWDKFDERKQLWEQKISGDYELVAQRYGERKKIFEERLKNDPWCDEVCQQIQIHFMEQEFRHEQERLADDLAREVNRIESEKIQKEKDNPLSGKCNTKEECIGYCQNNFNQPECQWLLNKPEPLRQFRPELDCQPPMVWYEKEQKCAPPGEIIEDCGKGFYWDSGRKECAQDPYYHPPEEFKQCPWGSRWNDYKGFCEKDFVDCAPKIGPNNEKIYPAGCAVPQYNFCPPEYLWDDVKKECVFKNFTDCGVGFYFDYSVKKCISENKPQCPVGEYWDEFNKICIRGGYSCEYVQREPCQSGQYRESYKDEKGCWQQGECVGQVTTACPGKPYPCPAGEFRKEWKNPNGCIEYGECYKVQTACAAIYSQPCPEGYNRDFFNDANGCLIPGECKPFVKPEVPTYCGDGLCDIYEQKYANCFEDCGEISRNWCGDGSCVGDEPTTCPADCPVSIAPCGNNNCSSDSYCADSNKGICCLKSQTFCATDGRCVESGTSCQTDYCGDGRCAGAETSAICPSDCGAVAGDCSINFANNYNGSKTCSKTNCPNGCQYNVEGCPTECLAPGVTEYCGDGKCDSKESYSTCPLDCKTLSCGDGVCASGETTTSCPSDCKSTTVTPTTPITGYCGDGICNNSESVISCPVDCKSTGATNTSCTTGQTTCDYTACPSGCNWDANGCVAGCWSQETSCANMTGWYYDSNTNTCVREGVTCSTPTACSACPSGSGTSNSWCNYDNDGCPTGCQTSSGGGGSTSSCTTGNTTCDYTACPSGCSWDSSGCVSGCQTSSGGGGSGGSTSSYCGDYVCNNSESSTSCPSDCGSASGDGSGSGSSCGSNPATCASAEECAAVNFFWCSGACYSNSSMCPTSFLPNNRIVWKKINPVYQTYKDIAFNFKSIFAIMVRAISGF